MSMRCNGGGNKSLPGIDSFFRKIPESQYGWNDIPGTSSDARFAIGAQEPISSFYGTWPSDNAQGIECSIKEDKDLAAEQCKKNRAKRHREKEKANREALEEQCDSLWNTCENLESEIKAWYATKKGIDVGQKYSRWRDWDVDKEHPFVIKPAPPGKKRGRKAMGKRSQMQQERRTKYDREYQKRKKLNMHRLKHRKPYLEKIERELKETVNNLYLFDGIPPDFFDGIPPSGNPFNL